jgi:CRP-like cAMP-binding protein
MIWNLLEQVHRLESPAGPPTTGAILKDHRDDRRILRQRLRNLPLFRGLGRKEIVLVASHVETLDFAAGQTLVRRGSFAREFIVLVDGELEVTGPADRRVLRNGEWFGHDGLVDCRVVDATVAAISASTVLVMARRDFMGLISAIPQLAQRLLLETPLMPRRIIRLDERALENSPSL